MHGDHHHGGVAQRWQGHAQVAGHVGEGVGSGEVGRRGIGHGAIGVHAGGAIARSVDHGHRGGVHAAVVQRIGVVGQHGDGHGRILIGGGCVIIGHRRVVHRIDRNEHRGDGAEPLIVAHGVVEDIGAVEVRAGGVGDGAVRVGHRRTVRWCHGHLHGTGHEHSAHRFIVLQHRDDHEGILVQEHVIIHRQGEGVGHGDHQDGRVAQRRCRHSQVADAIRDRVVAYVVLIRGVGDGAIGVGHRRTVVRSADDGDARCIHRRLIEQVVVVGPHVGDERGVGQHVVHIIVGHGRIVHRRHDEGDGSRIAEPDRITELVGEVHGTVEVCCTIEGDHTGGAIIGPGTLSGGHRGLQARGVHIQVHGELAYTVGGRSGVAVGIGVVQQHIDRAVGAVL